jgi:thymidylate kinase
MTHSELTVSENLKLFITFGRPGAGKTTVSSLAFEQLVERRAEAERPITPISKVDETPTIDLRLISLDLDCCIPQWMKDNFSRGIYPTMQERREFAQSACDHVREQCANEGASSALVSFSFVNADIREFFRQSFPSSTWILMDTDEETAQQRIQQRKNHFFRRKLDACVAAYAGIESSVSSPSLADNADWQFAPVTFDHIVLNGKEDAETNASKIVHLVERHMSSVLH